MEGYGMTIAPIIKVKLLRDGANVPEFMSEGAAGADLRACLNERIVLEPGERVLVSTGIEIEIPGGYEGEVRPRSGLAVRHGISLVNSPGTIDSDYRGEVKIIMINHGDRPFEINHGDRIAQLLINKVERPIFEIVDELTDTERAEGGFGSSGK